MAAVGRAVAAGGAGSLCGLGRARQTSQLPPSQHDEREGQEQPKGAAAPGLGAAVGVDPGHGGGPSGGEMRAGRTRMHVNANARAGRRQGESGRREAIWLLPAGLARIQNSRQTLSTMLPGAGRGITIGVGKPAKGPTAHAQPAHPRATRRRGFLAAPTLRGHTGHRFLFILSAAAMNIVTSSSAMT